MKRNKHWMAAAVVCLCLTACGSGQDQRTADDPSVAENAGQEMPDREESGQEGAENDAADADGSVSDSIGSDITDSIFTCGEMSVVIPQSWLGKVNVKETDNGFCFIQKASAEKEPDSGFMCGFYRSKEIVYSFTGEIPLACTEDTIYYAQEPTDVPCADSPEIINEYGELMGSLSKVQNSFAVDDAKVRYSRGEYMMLGSDIAQIPEDVLANMNLYELWIARNEIYARHGRKFDNFHLQQYFDACSWYQRTTEGKDFDESVLNETEKKNVIRIRSMEDQKKAENPYPVLYKPGQTVQEDLDGDGRKEKICVTFRDGGRADMPQAFLNIDGKEYDLCQMGADLIEADTERFYITDIWSWEAGLEVAVMDYGPSYDLVTHFFRYDGDLSYIGSIEGIPFKEEMGFDGFYMDGAICSQIRADVISSAYAYGTWWADSTNDTLYFNGGVCRMVYDGPHKLLVDLPMYEYMNDEADTFVMNAGEEVCFVETDAKEWIGVKSRKDAVKGYIRCRDWLIEPVGKEPDAVFSDLQYFD